MPLTNQQTKHLKRLAHHLAPVVIVGQHGLTEGVLNEVSASLEAHELIKVKVNAADREEREAMLAAIAASASAELVQRIGHVAVFYRANPGRPRISLPKP
jgi:RNA-binding protein